MPEIYPGLSTAEYWTIGIIGAIILFISVLLHELAHSIIALKYGLNVHQISVSELVFIGELLPTTIRGH
jgi:Zn-dependent protease